MGRWYTAMVQTIQMPPDALMQPDPFMLADSRFIPLTEIETGVMQKKSVMSLSCPEIGMDCLFKCRGSTESGLMREFIEHAGISHNLDVLPADLLLKIKLAIKQNSQGY